MWEEIITPEGKLLFRINRKKKLVEEKKSDWNLLVRFESKEVRA